jgi:hypothetical protein
MSGVNAAPALYVRSVSGALDRGVDSVHAAKAHVRSLFPDGGRGFMEEFYRTAGFTPVNHLVRIQQRVVEENP